LCNSNFLSNFTTGDNVTTDYLVINDDSCHGNKWGKHASHLNQPLIVPAGNIVRNITMLNGFLVDVGVEAVVFILRSPNLSYTVPTGKYLTITLFYSGYPKNLLVDNIQISDSDIKDEASQERMPYLIPSGSIIKSEDDTRICVTGYLMSN
jgi:hypothetical protein